MISTATKDASRLGTLIRPNGTRLPITGLQSEGKISVTVVYVEVETPIGAAIAFGCSLEDAPPALCEDCDNATAWTRRWMIDAPN